jgi:hypothetical protein
MTTMTSIWNKSLVEILVDGHDIPIGVANCRFVRHIRATLVSARPDIVLAIYQSWE